MSLINSSHFIKYSLAFIFAWAMISPLHSNAQDRCATVPYMKILYEKKSILESERNFEQWLHDKIQTRTKTLGTKRQQASTYQIPVVVHVIHNGEAIGAGSNISDEQILSQIDVLNNDYKRLNADAANTPGEFLPVAGSLDIEFVMAKRTPEGLATTGIVRVQGTKTSWSINDNYELKSLSYWPAEEYLNIWVTTLTTSYVGFAQFPVSNLPGLENSSNNRLTDGVVIDYSAFGTIDVGSFDLDPQFNKGRTTTHEVGHFLGLRHIWGDDEDESDKCLGTDYVDDTPNQQVNTSGCPTTTRTSCGSNDMYMNYLDYTNDACMNLFTQGQIGRMIAVLENSPRRVSLLTSPGLLDPAPVANDLGIKSIIQPAEKICSSSVTPTIEIKNYGSNNITSAQIMFSLNGTTVETKSFPLSLAPLASIQVSFTPIVIASQTNTFSFEINQTNGTTDGNVADNIRNVTSELSSFINLPFAENFDVVPTSWDIQNPDQLITWAPKTAPNGNSANKAMYINFYDYEDRFGEVDILATPVFDLSVVPSAYLAFDVSYAVFQNSTDGLRVVVMTDCQSPADGTIVYEKTGSQLATAPSTSVPFTPSDNSQWRREIIDLTPFLGNPRVQLAFIAINDWGNNLYLDDVAVITTSQEDLILKAVISPTPVRCDNQVIPQLQIQNAGTVEVTSFLVETTVNNGTPQFKEITTSIQPGETMTLTLSETTLVNGSNKLSFILSEPNGLIDINPDDNSRSLTTIINNAEGIIPLRENFDENFESDWVVVNPTEGFPWEKIATNYNQSIFFNAFDNIKLGDEAWLVSPVLDFSSAQSASMFFDVSYAFNTPRYDQLRILLSKDCGKTYSTVAFDQGGEDLSVTSSSSSWSPIASADWNHQYVNLNTLALEKNARLAFVVTNANGNNLYVDNIEFFTSDNPDPPAIEGLFLIYGTQPTDPGSFYLTFNLSEPQTIGYEILDAMGREIVSTQVDNVLNQTFLVDAGHTATGIYIVRVRIAAKYYSTKVFLSGN
ncbi:MAG TPA: M43 family zinc metalloprotease [Cyclobacteriaceae bacterium]|nr:M43 family zinc metalloprotease [Cyclobacteriaceae bacterium]